MIRHDLICPACGHEEDDRLFTLDRIEAWKTDPIASPLATCPTCEADTDRLIPMEIRYTSAHGFGNALLKEDFVIDVHDGHTRYHGRVSSLSELRAIERESEKHAANEPGCAPLVFRDFAQGKSNRAVNALTGTKWERGRAKKLTKRETVSGLRINARAIPEDEAMKR